MDSDVAELATLGCATVYDASGLDCCLASRLRPVWEGARAVGPAFTVKPIPGDTLAVARAVREAPAGSVLVIDGQGLEFGYFGEALAHIAAVRRVAGAVVDGCVRDVDAIAELGFPLFAGGVFVRRTSQRHEGVLGEQVTVGNRTVNTGDVVLADSDGIVVIPVHQVRRTVTEGRLRRQADLERISAIRSGVIPPVRLELDS